MNLHAQGKRGEMNFLYTLMGNVKIFFIIQFFSKKFKQNNKVYVNYSPATVVFISPKDTSALFSSRATSVLLLFAQACLATSTNR